MFTLKFSTDNAAFDESPTGEVARILADVARRITEGEFSGKVTDDNGNTVGSFNLTGEA